MVQLLLMVYQHLVALQEEQVLIQQSPIPYYIAAYFYPPSFSYANEPVLWILDILVRLGSAPLTNGSKSCSGSCYFRP
jgi:hypothetical protein